MGFKKEKGKMLASDLANTTNSIQMLAKGDNDHGKGNL
jgi:hypothetical protein